MNRGGILYKKLNKKKLLIRLNNKGTYKKRFNYYFFKTEPRI